MHTQDSPDILEHQGVKCDWIYKNQSKLQKSIFCNCLTLKATFRCTKYMAKYCQVCFHRGLFGNPVKPQRCTTEPVWMALIRIWVVLQLQCNNHHCLSVCPVDCACFCPLLKTQYHCLCPNGSCVGFSSTPATLPPIYPLINATHDITVTVKNLLKIQQC